MSKVIGIDLGTSNSCVAYVKGGRPVVIADKDGNKTTPSVFTLDSTFEPIVGYAAKAQADLNRENTIFAVKRLIGRKFASDEIQGAAEKLPYKIIAAENGDAWVEVREKPKSPEEISACILTKMREVAEEFFNERVHRAVITVPAHFNDAQRQATKDAGKIAGLDVMRIINEPTAAALAYGLDVVTEEEERSEGRNVWKKRNKADRIIAVFDLGGGTFDISILSMKEGVFDVLATNGDTYLGGEDFDLTIVNHLIEHFKQNTGKDLRENKGALEKLKQAARQAKHDLTDKPKVDVELSFVQGLEHLRISLERKDLEQIVEPSLKRLEDPCLMALEDAELKPEDITDVVLVGGMTRMPAVKKRCEKIFGVKPLDTIDPDEAVALGAAAQAGLLEGFVRGVSLLDVTSLSLGIEVQGGMTHVILPRNTTIPAAHTETFTTSAPNQPQVDIHVIQGESEFAPNNKSLGMFKLQNIRPAPRGEPDISVTFEVDAEGIVHVSAKDLETGDEQKIEIIASSGLEDEEIESILREQRMLEEQANQHFAREKEEGAEEEGEEETDELTEFRESLKSLIFMTQFKLNSEGKGFKGKQRALLDESLAGARAVLEGDSELETVKKALSSLYEAAASLDEFLEKKI